MSRQTEKPCEQSVPLSYPTIWARTVRRRSGIFLFRQPGSPSSMWNGLLTPHATRTLLFLTLLCIPGKFSSSLCFASTQHINRCSTDPNRLYASKRAYSTRMRGNCGPTHVTPTGVIKSGSTTRIHTCSHTRTDSASRRHQTEITNWGRL